MTERLALPVAGDVLVGKYRLERVVGQGGMGVVFEATHTTIGQKVAVKVLRPQVAGSPQAGERFIREARAAGRLRSRHAVRIHDVDATPLGLPFLVLEWLVGHDVDTELEARGPLPVEEAVRFILEAGDAVAEAHEAGIVHRDLKPSNLFLSEERSGRVCKVLDFGISKLPEATDQSITSTDASLGTPLYMSPEQIRSARDVDARSDVWALGVILYELVAGRPPFMGETVTSTAAAIVADTPRDLAFLRPEAPAALVEIVMRCLDKDPAGRPADGAALVLALRAISEPGGSGHVAVRPAGPRPLETTGEIAHGATLLDRPRDKQARTASEWESAASKPPAPSRRAALVAVPFVIGALAVGGFVGLRAWSRDGSAPGPSAPLATNATITIAAADAAPSSSAARAPATPLASDAESAVPQATARRPPAVALPVRPAGPRTTGAGPQATASATPTAAPSARPLASNPYLL